MKNFILFLTTFRIISGPIIFYLLVFEESYFISLVLFGVSSVSDYLDGFYARKYDVETELGKILDPIADKILLLFTLMAIFYISLDPILGLMITFLLAREFWVSAIREYAMHIGRSEATRVTYLAKIKTTVQFLAIFLFMLGLTLDYSLMIFLSKFIFFLALLISIKTSISYTANLSK